VRLKLEDLRKGATIIEVKRYNSHTSIL